MNKVTRQRLKEQAEAAKSAKAEPPVQEVSFTEMFDPPPRVPTEIVKDAATTYTTEPKRNKKGKIIPPPLYPPHPEGNKKTRAFNKRQMARGRLPHGSEFKVSYNAALTSWSGTLTVPGCPEPFHGRQSGVEMLLRRLYDCYAAWKARTEAKAAQEAQA